MSATAENIDTTASDTITILHSVGPVLTKTWLKDGNMKGYGNALTFTAEERHVGSFADMCAILKSIEDDAQACVIRGTLREDWREIQAKNLPEWNEERRVKAEKQGHPFIAVNPQGDQLLRRKALFHDRPHYWMLDDVDGFPMKPGEDYAHAIERYIQTLPPEFAAAAYYWQLSSSAGRADNVGKLKTHLWFWLDRKLDSRTLSAWASTLDGVKIDTCIFNEIQIHYTAAPIFEAGAARPLLVRSGFEDGLAEDAVSIVLTDSVVSQAKRPSKSKHDLHDPRDKPGIIGDFHRAFSIEHVLAEFIPGEFEWVTDDRLTWLGGSGAQEGVYVREDRQGLGASHSTWPWGTGRTANKWDLVRHFKFCHLDASADPLQKAINDDPTKSESQTAMLDWARELPEILGPEEVRRREQIAENRRIGEGTDAVPFADKITLTEALERFVYVGDGKGVFDIKHPTHYLDLSSFKQFYSASREKVGRVWVGVPRLWGEHPDRMSVISRSFKAGEGLFIPDPDGRSAVNTWRDFDRSGFEMQQDHVDLFIDHVAFIFCDETDRFLDWLAHIEQQPGELPHSAWLSIATSTGLGRNWISSVLSRLWAGRVAANFDILGMFEKGFNGRLSGKILACVDEIKAGGSDAWPHSEKLKAIVTEETREINPKYGRQFVEHNAVRWLIFSNHLAAIPLEANDRRWEVVINEAKPLSSAYYTNLYRALQDQRFIQSIAMFLRSRDISGFNPGAHAKATGGKEHVINTSKSDFDMACESVVTGWPSDVIFGSDLMFEVFGHSNDRRSNLLKSAMPRLGARPFGKQVKAEGRPERAWILRNIEKWMFSESAGVSAEGVKGRTEAKLERDKADFESMSGNASNP